MSVNSFGFGINHQAKQYLIVRFVTLCVCCVLPSFFSSAYAQTELGFSMWDLKSDSQCKEVISFLGEKEFLLESGDQVSTKAYKFNQFRKTDFYIFSQRTTAYNGGNNCSGMPGSRVGTRVKTYVKFNEDATLMSIYAEPKDDSEIILQYAKRVYGEAAE